MLLLCRCPPCVVSLFFALFGGCHGMVLIEVGRLERLTLLCNVSSIAGHDVQCERVLAHVKRLAYLGCQCWWTRVEQIWELCSKQTNPNRSNWSVLCKAVLFLPHSPSSSSHHHPPLTLRSPYYYKYSDSSTTT